MANFLHFLFTAIVSVSNLLPSTLPSTVVEDLNNLNPPSDFNSTITRNCLSNPSLRYCNDLDRLREIFKSTIVASHLCNISGNPNCVDSLPEINLRSRPSIAPLYLSFTFFWKYCPLTVSSIDLSNNSLKGHFPTKVLYCSQIRALDLSRNALSGDVPVESFSSLENLTLLNLSCNHFSEGRISETDRLFDRFNSSGFIHSGLVPDHRGFTIKAVLLFVGLPVFVIVSTVLILSGWLGFFRNEHEFTSSALRAATDGFSSRNLAGKNAYRGILRDGSEVRIEIDRSDKWTREVRKRFVEKSKILVQLRHKNIVPVLGWWDSRSLRATVTRWIDTGDSIETWLANSVPPWEQRVKVILGIAAGICYLHEEWRQVDYNLETKYVILSEDGEPLITRLKLVEHHSSTKKAYKLGMFMLEIVTNRRPVEEFVENEVDFIEWVKMQYPGNVENLIDKRMKRTVGIVSEAAEVIEFGLMCTDLSSDPQCPSWDNICDLLSDISSAAEISAPMPDHRIRAHGGHNHVRRHRGWSSGA